MGLLQYHKCANDQLMDERMRQFLHAQMLDAGSVAQWTDSQTFMTIKRVRVEHRDGYVACDMGELNWRLFQAHVSGLIYSCRQLHQH